MKILINTPRITIQAGVANHYLGLKNFFSKDVIYNQYLPKTYIDNFVRLKSLGIFLTFLTKFYDLIKFTLLIFIYQRPNILLNPSFGKTALIRDAYFLRIAKFFGCKVAVFIHGWDKEYLVKVFENKVQFSKAWYHADAFFVLATEFKKYLRKLDINAPIYLTTTKVNDQLVEGVPLKKIHQVRNILFLARIETDKGIFLTIEAFNLLKRKYSDLQLKVVGSGTALNKAKEYSKEKNITGIDFTGTLSGESLKKEFHNSDIYMLPTHHEGMPTSVLEAMAFGLPVITRPVGGLVDFFENDKMGYMIESLNPEDYAEKIESLINDVGKANQISSYNAKYAKEHFMASKIAPLLEQQLLKF